jgi:hypothetical protein
VDADVHQRRDQATFDETVLVIGHLTYTGPGRHNNREALLANTAATHERECARVGRAELAVIAPNGWHEPAAA